MIAYKPIVHNLTDQALPGKKPSPHTITIGGVAIEPGQKAELRKVNLAKLSGMIYAGRVAIDKLPNWYVEVKRLRHHKIASDAAVSAPRDQQEEKIEVDVGVMTATAKAGPDSELGTEDDVKSAKPKAKPKGKKKGKKK